MVPLPRMPAFVVRVTIENKPGISDPEGETILNDLVLKGGYDEISNVRTAKMLKFTIQATDRIDAHSRIMDICDEIRIYNPLVSKVTATASKA